MYTKFNETPFGLPTGGSGCPEAYKAGALGDRQQEFLTIKLNDNE